MRALAIKGVVPLEQLAEVVLAAPEALEEVIQPLLGSGFVESSGLGVRLSAEGKLKASALFAADRASAGEARSLAALEEFHVLDTRMKEIVTGWQVRDVAGQQVLNDHTDAAYDSGLLDALAELHSETDRWLSPLAAQIRRFAVYKARLARAADFARGGDQRFISSPRVDSYHSVWFELHEDLIRLSGRRRSDEVATGRA